MPPVPGVVKLPLTAVFEQGGQTNVWLVDPAAMTVRAQSIAVAGADGNLVVVAGGLQPGQAVVTAGVHTLTPGQKVRWYAEPGAAPAAAASRGSAASAASPAASR
jgi:multidrug efflux pump subunit AcrA (membrane-fusion protein)